MTEDYIEFFLNSNSNIVQFETIELIHPDFSETHRVVRNNTNGLTATLETAAVVTFDYYPMKIDHNSSQDDLEYSIKLEFGDLGELLPTELDLITVANSFSTKPILKYRTFRSDVLTEPMFGPIELEIIEMSFNKNGVTFEAKAPQLIINKTGELYTINRFPMLRGFL